MVESIAFYECEPFSLMNALATFQRLIERCLGDLYLKYCFIYLDDIIFFSKTLMEDIKGLCGVFEKLWVAGLRLKTSKCNFFCTRLAYLGHIVSENGIETNPKKSTAIKNWPAPTTVTEESSFLGCTTHYRHFIHIYAHIMHPLSFLVVGDNANK